MGVAWGVCQNKEKPRPATIAVPPPLDVMSRLIGFGVVTLHGMSTIRLERLLPTVRLTEELWLALYAEEETVRLPIPGKTASDRVRYALAFGLNEIGKLVEQNRVLPGFNEIHEELELK